MFSVLGISMGSTSCRMYSHLQHLPNSRIFIWATILWQWLEEKTQSNGHGGDMSYAVYCGIGEVAVFLSLSGLLLCVQQVLSPNEIAPRVMVAVATCQVNSMSQWSVIFRKSFPYLFCTENTNMILISYVKLKKWLVERLQYTSFKWSSD